MGVKSMETGGGLLSTKSCYFISWVILGKSFEFFVPCSVKWRQWECHHIGLLWRLNELAFEKSLGPQLAWRKKVTVI